MRFRFTFDGLVPSAQFNIVGYQSRNNTWEFDAAAYREFIEEVSAIGVTAGTVAPSTLSAISAALTQFAKHLRDGLSRRKLGEGLATKFMLDAHLLEDDELFELARLFEAALAQRARLELISNVQ